MKIKRILSFLVLVIIIASMAACTRSKVQEKAVTEPATVPEGGTPGATDVLDTLYVFATQTALAGQGQPITPPGGGELTPISPPAGQNTPLPEQPTPLPTQQIILPTATPGLPATYTLHKGEFPYCIARRFNVNPGELLSLNGLSPSSPTYPGMTLKIPQTGNPFPGNRALSAHPTTYVVKAGDTIYSIACLFGDVSPEAIAYVNNLSEPYTLTVGQTLNIP